MPFRDKLLDLGLGAGFLQLGNQLLGVFLGDGFLQGLGAVVNQILSILQAQAGSGTDKPQMKVAQPSTLFTVQIHRNQPNAGPLHVRRHTEMTC